MSLQVIALSITRKPFGRLTRRILPIKISVCGILARPIAACRPSLPSRTAKQDTHDREGAFDTNGRPLVYHRRRKPMCPLEPDATFDPEKADA